MLKKLKSLKGVDKMKLRARVSVIFSILLVTQLYGSEQNQSRAFFPDPGFTCCSVMPDLFCSIAESMIAGLIFPSCPCSATCRLACSIDELQPVELGNNMQSQMQVNQ